jgi:hypothetical protein
MAQNVTVKTSKEATTAGSGTDRIKIAPYSTTTDTVLLPAASKVPMQARGSSKDIESAVYAHIQALRALGKTQVNTIEIARSLDLSLAIVEKVIADLRSKGVKIVNA